jgi:glycosyltransferase involved in cell wall biosynthesis
MKVLLVGNYRPDRQYSMLGFEQALAELLPAQGVEVATIHPRAVAGTFGNRPDPSKWAGYVDKFGLFRRDLRRAAKKADLVHVLDQGNGVWVPWIANRPHLVTVHDLLALRASRGEIPGWAVGRSGQKLQGWIQKGLSAARNVVVDSEATREDFRRLYPRNPDPKVISLGTFRTLRRRALDEARESVAALLPSPEAPFLLHVGGNQMYKNRIGAVRIHRELRRLDPERMPRLVLAGHALDPDVRAEAAPGLLDGTVVEVVRPSDSQVEALYSLAEGFLFPSLMEGFGVPVLESQQCGCPVFASNRAPIPEVGGSGGVYFDPDDVEGAARSIVQAWDRRAALVEEGARNAASHTSERMASQYAEAYRRILG